MNKSIMNWQIYLAFLTGIVGGLLHFVYEWSGNFKPLALIAAVNESTWEHLKLSFWPTFIFAIIEFFYIKKVSKNFYLAKSLSLIICPITVIVLFYGYLAIFGNHSLFYDIFIFYVGIALSYYISYKLLSSEKELQLSFKYIGISLIVVLVLLFSLFTYFAPHNFLFKDPSTDCFGIIK